MVKTERILLAFFTFLLFALLPPKTILPQSVSNELYETEEDLKEGLENGDLTYDEYLELLDLIRSKVNIDSEDTTRLLFIPDVTAMELTEPPAPKTRNLRPLDRTIPFLKTLPERKTGLKGEFVWQTYQKIEEGKEAESFAILRIQNGKRFSFDLRVEQNESRRFETQKRSLKLLNLWNSSSLILGNFDRKIGLGLNIGYHPLFSYSLGDTVNVNDSFLYPIQGRYNGLFLESKFKTFRPGFMASKNRFGSLKDKVYALDLGFIHKRSKVGILLSKAELRNSSTGNFFRDDCGSAYLDLFWKNLRLSSEYAMMWNNEKGFALNFAATRRFHRVSGYFWWYSAEFVHPHGGGVSNPDYESIDILDDLDFSYRSKQRGERGILLKTSYQLFSNLSFDFALNQWRKNPLSGESLKLKTGGRYRVTENLLTELHLLWTDDLEVSKTDYFSLSWDWVYSFVDEPYLRLRSNYRTRKLETRTKDYGDIQIRIGDLDIFPFRMNVWLRYADPDFSISRNSYWNLYFEEKLCFVEHCFLSVRYLAKLHQTEHKTDLHAVRLRWEMEW